MFKIPVKKVKQPTFCSLPFTRVILDSHAVVSMCCHQGIHLGQAVNQVQLMDLWRGDLAQEIRDATLSGKLHPACSFAGTCPYLKKKKIVGPCWMYEKALYPLNLELCLPETHCNIGGEHPTSEHPACLMCKRNYGIPKHDVLTDLLCEKARPALPYLSGFTVLGTAEPFWKHELFHVFDRLGFDEFADNIEFSTNTNGICVNEELAEIFFQRVKWSSICWSLDATTGETYQKLRRLNVFDLVVRNLKHWLERRNAYGGVQHHRVAIYNNINLINVHEVVGMVDMAADLGVDKLLLLPTYDQGGMSAIKGILLSPENAPIFAKAGREAEQRAKERGVDLIFTTPLSSLFSVETLASTKLPPRSFL